MASDDLKQEHNSYGLLLWFFYPFFCASLWSLWKLHEDTLKNNNLLLNNYFTFFLKISQINAYK